MFLSKVSRPKLVSELVVKNGPDITGGFKLARRFSVGLIALFSITAIFSCGSENTELTHKCYQASRKMGLHHITDKIVFPNAKTNQIFKPYIEEFSSYYGGGIGDIPVFFHETNSEAMALCSINSFGKKVIVVNESWWGEISRLDPELAEAGKKAVLFHELAHCVLNRFEHDDSFVYVDVDGLEERLPRTMMRTVLHAGDFQRFFNFQEEYVKELFSGSLPTSHTWERPLPNSAFENED